MSTQNNWKFYKKSTIEKVSFEMAFEQSNIG